MMRLCKQFTLLPFNNSTCCVAAQVFPYPMGKCYKLYRLFYEICIGERKFQKVIQRFILLRFFQQSQLEIKRRGGVYTQLAEQYISAIKRIYKLKIETLLNSTLPVLAKTLEKL